MNTFSILYDNLLLFIYQGKWAQYDPITEEACHSFTQPFFKIGNDFEGVLIYENVFCWLCNANSESGVPTLCQDLAEHPSRTQSGKFSALIDYKRLEEIENKESLVESRHCSRQEIYDEYMVCLKQIYETLSLYHSKINIIQIIILSGFLATVIML